MYRLMSSDRNDVLSGRSSRIPEFLASSDPVYVRTPNIRLTEPRRHNAKERTPFQLYFMRRGDRDTWGGDLERAGERLWKAVRWVSICAH